MKIASALVYFFFLFVVFCIPVWGQRTTPFDIYVVIDSSTAMENGKNEALSWLCTTLVDSKLIDGDGLFVWTAGVKPELLYFGAVSENVREEVKILMRKISFSGGASDYKSALGEARSRILAVPGRLNCTFLVSGVSPGIHDAEAAGFLRYSRVESFSGWKVITIGLDVEAKVRRSAASFMNKKMRT